MEQADKLIWTWISLKGGTVTAPANPSSLNPLKAEAVWQWLFKRSRANGPSLYVRAEKALLGIRLRAKAYRKAGTELNRCTEATLMELVGHMDASKTQKGIPSPSEDWNVW